MPSNKFAENRFVLKLIYIWNSIKKYLLPYLNQGNNLFKATTIRTIIISFIFIILYLLIQDIINYKITQVLLHFVFFNPEERIDKIFCVLIFYSISILIIFSFNLQYRKLNIADYIIIFVWLRYTIFSEFLLFNKPSFVFLPKGTIWFKYINIIVIYYILLLLPIFAKIFFRKVKDKGNSKEADYFYPDLSLGSLSEKNNQKIGESDEYGFTGIADGIADLLIKVKPEKKAFSIGINGKWGSGKTSLIELAIDKYKKKNANKENIIWFNPWHFKDSEILIKDFFFLLEKYMAKNYGHKAKTLVHEYFQFLVNIEKAFFSTTFINSLFNNEKEGDILDKKKKVIEVLSSQDDKIIIVIDDIDRLDKNEIVTVLRLIRIIADFPNIVYVVGYDRDYITYAIKSNLTEGDYKTYLDKIINTEYRIPQLTKNVVKKNLEKYICGKIKIVNQEEIHACCEISGIDSFIKNHRDIVRFSNNLVMQRTLLKEEIIFGHLFILELLRYRYPDLINKMFYNIESIIDEIGNENNIISYEKLSLDGGDKEQIINLLNKLFNQENLNQEKSICSKIYYPRYFSIRHFITDNDFKEILEGGKEEELNRWMISAHSKNSENLRKIVSTVQINTKYDEIFCKALLHLLERWEDKYDPIEKKNGMNVFFLSEIICNSLGRNPRILNSTSLTESNNFKFQFLQKNNSIKFKIVNYRYSFLYKSVNFKEIVYNDQYLYHPFNFRDYTYEIKIIPKVDFWRVGFKIGSNIDIPTDPENRSQNGYPLIVLCAGDLNKNNESIASNRLSRDFYQNGAETMHNKDQEHITSDSYTIMDPISIRMDFEEKTGLAFKVIDKIGNTIFKENFNYPNKFTHFILSSWADRNILDIEIEISLQPKFP
jgi:Cdc6-like AAA superfamily ATPase